MAIFGPYRRKDIGLFLLFSTLIYTFIHTYIFKCNFLQHYCWRTSFLGGLWPNNSGGEVILRLLYRISKDISFQQSPIQKNIRIFFLNSYTRIFRIFYTY